MIVLSKSNIDINTDNLYLTRLNEKFISERYLEWLNDKDLVKYTEVQSNQTYSSLEEYILNCLNKNVYFWAIIHKKTNTHIGNIKIDPINTRHGFAEYGILIGEKKFSGKGFAKEASKAVVDYCFEKLNIRKICLGVIEENRKALNLYLSMGFKIEGVYKAHRKVGNAYLDEIRLAKFKHNG